MKLQTHYICKNCIVDVDRDETSLQTNSVICFCLYQFADFLLKKQQTIEFLFICGRTNKLPLKMNFKCV